MGISIQEFRIAMEVYGATRLADCLGSRYRLTVPCFRVADTIFFHSGSYYIVQRGNSVTNEMMNRAMAELGETFPGGDNFWYAEIHSVKGILTLVAILEHKYSKELIYELTNETYKRLLGSAFITKNASIAFCNSTTLHGEKLYALLMKYNNLVNPFGSGLFTMKNPIQYLDTISICFGINAKEQHQYLSLTNGSYETDFRYRNGEWTYKSTIPTRRNGHNGYIYFSHYLCEHGSPNTDEVLTLRYKVKKNDFNQHPADIDLHISLKTGLAWEAYKKEEAKPVTIQQIQLMITYLEVSIKKIRTNITRYMIQS